MPLTQVEICNLALEHIGIKARIEAITDNTTPARSCNLHYNNTLECALAEADWDFARRRVALVLHAGTAPEEWGYQYDYPTITDIIRVVRLDDQLQSRLTEDLIPFVLETNSSGSRLIYTDLEDAVAIYTHRTTDPTLYTPHFAAYLSRCLAARIAAPLTGDDQSVVRLEQLAMLELSRAVRKTSQGSKNPARTEASWISAR